MCCVLEEKSFQIQKHMHEVPELGVLITIGAPIRKGF